jgi:GT2 family glycosyltransferase
MAADATQDRPLAGSILICTYNRREALADCLAALPWEAVAAQRVEVIVVDDGSTDGTSTFVPKQFPATRLLVNTPNRGLAFSRNRAGNAAQGRLLLYLDDDTAVQPGWLDAMLAHDNGHRLLGGRILDWTGGREQGGPARFTFLGKRLPCALDRANVGTGANLATPAACFAVLGGFDEELPYYFEDSDYCIRAHRAGFGFAYVPAAVVRHRGSEKKSGHAIYMQERNSTYAMLKAYRGDWGRLLAFTVGNGAWMISRLLLWSLQLRFRDAGRLLRGWAAAYAQFARRVR